MNVDTFRDIHNHLAISKTQMEHIQGQLHQDPLNEERQEQEKVVGVVYLDILDSSIKLMR